MSLRQPTDGVRAFALLPLAAFVVHQIRYLGGYGHEVDDALASQGHWYLTFVLPILVSIGGGVVGTVLFRASLGRSAQRRAAPSLLGRSLACALALVVIFSAQELLEGALVGAHPSGLDAVLGHGGWIVLPAAVALGGLLALLLAGLAAAESWIAETRSTLRVRAPRQLEPGSNRRARSLTSDPLVFGLARRPPPHPSPAS
jgi:hypothetical protein